MDVIINLAYPIERLDGQKKRTTLGQYIATVLHEIVIGETAEESEKLYLWAKNLYDIGALSLTKEESDYLYDLISRMKIPVCVKTPSLKIIKEAWQ